MDYFQQILRDFSPSLRVGMLCRTYIFQSQNVVQISRIPARLDVTGSTVVSPRRHLRWRYI